MALVASEPEDNESLGWRWSDKENTTETMIIEYVKAHCAETHETKPFFNEVITLGRHEMSVQSLSKSVYMSPNISV